MELINKHNFRELKKIVDNQIFSRVLVIGGAYSFRKSGAEKLIYRLLKNKEIAIFFKTKKLPEFIEFLLKIYRPFLNDYLIFRLTFCQDF